MNALQQQEKRGAPTRAKTFISPEVNIFESKEAYILEAEMPGVSKEGIEITLEGNELTLTGHRSDEQLAGEVVYRESRPADYQRTFEIDPTIDTGKIEAKIEQGVLRLTLPKSEKVKPRKINIS